MTEKKEKEMISREEASEQVLSIINRLALVYYCFSNTLIKELGEEKGKEIVKKAIYLYGEWVGKRVKEKTLAKGLPTLPENFQDDLPSLGWQDKEKVIVDGEKRSRIYTCYLAKAWKELEAPGLGRLYCHVDQAKYKAYNPDLECVHIKNVLDGDPYCELAVRTREK